MKKVILSLIFTLISIVSFGQIYSKIEYYDKFDDCLKTENVKTLISKSRLNDRWLIFTVETKNKPIKKFACYYPTVMSVKYGDEENVINLINNVYGYQTDYICCDIKDTLDFKIKIITIFAIIDSIYHNKDISTKYSYTREYITEEYEKVFILTDRTITTQYTKSFLNRYFWIRKNDDSRIIYTDN